MIFAESAHVEQKVGVVIVGGGRAAKHLYEVGSQRQGPSPVVGYMQTALRAPSTRGVSKLVHVGFPVHVVHTLRTGVVAEATGLHCASVVHVHVRVARVAPTATE